MRNKIIVIGLVGAAVYLLGARSHRPVKGKQPETVRQQAERLWRDPKSVKARKKLRKDAVARAEAAVKAARKRLG